MASLLPSRVNDEIATWQTTKNGQRRRLLAIGGPALGRERLWRRELHFDRVDDLL